MTNSQRICLLSMHGLGDLLMFLPTIQSVSRNFPDHPISVFVRNKTSKELLELAHLAAHITVEYPEQKGSWRFKQTFSPLANLRCLNPINFWALNKLRASQPEITIAMTKMNPYLTPLMCRYSGSRISIGETAGWGKYFYTHPIHTDTTQHRMHQNLDLLSPLLLPETGRPEIRLYPDSQHDIFENLTLQACLNQDQIKIAIAPCVTMGQPWRLWPASHWATLIDLLYQRMGVVCYLLGSSSKEDKDITNTIVEHIKAPHSIVNLCGQLSIKQIVLLISKMDWICGIDCGLLHIAASVGTRIIAIWAATQTQHYPFTEKKDILHLRCKCRGNYPKSIRKTCRQKSECLTNFTAEEAFSMILKIVK